MKSPARKPKAQKAHMNFLGLYLVGAIGLEPTTPTMSRWCSNQLSYEPTARERDSSKVSSHRQAIIVPADEKPHQSRLSHGVATSIAASHCLRRAPGNSPDSARRQQPFQRLRDDTTPVTPLNCARARCNCPPSRTSTVNCINACAPRDCVLTPVTLSFSRENTSEMSRSKP